MKGNPGDLVFGIFLYLCFYYGYCKDKVRVVLFPLRQ